MGGYVQGNQFGLISKGKDFGIYVDGNTITNKPIIQLEESEGKRIATYAITSTSVDVTTRGKVKLINGEAFVNFNDTFINSISTSEIGKNVDNEDSINITITPIGDCNGVFVKQITNKGFFIKENNKGVSNVALNWTAIGTRKGYEKGIEITDEILDKDFDSKMSGVMFNDGDAKNNGKPIYFDGNKVRFEESPSELNKPKEALLISKVEKIIVSEK